MRAAWLSLPAMFAACSFTSPDPFATDGGPGDTGNTPTDGTPGCADDDHDTICNTADKCAGQDDRLDADTDGIPDGCDDWPCGAKPNDPGDANDLAVGRVWGADMINIGTSRRVVAQPGQAFNVSFHWGVIIFCGAPGSCRTQVEIGYGSTRLGCIFDGNVPDQQFTDDTHSSQLTAPMTPNVYEIKLQAARRTSCGTGTQWYNGTPGGNSTIAFLCVK